MQRVTSIVHFDPTCGQMSDPYPLLVHFICYGTMSWCKNCSQKGGMIGDLHGASINRHQRVQPDNAERHGLVERERKIERLYCD